jgi:hypothetical protein
MQVNVSRLGVLRVLVLIGVGALVVGCGGAQSGTVPTPCTPATPASSGPHPTPATPTDHVTFRHDGGRTGLDATESVLTPANVTAASFGLLRQLQVDGKVDAQPLYLSQLAIAGGVHNVVFAATEGGSVYAFDSDSGAQLWKVSLIPSGETTSDDRGCSQVTPNIGLTATPVIDRAAGKIFLVAMSKDATGSYHQRLHALDVTTGQEVAGSPAQISATYTGSGTTSTFLPGQYEERAALLLANGTVYTSWTSHCDAGPYGGWLIAYSESTLTQTAALNVAASSSKGPSIWMAGNGPAVDANGDLYLLTANGAFETTLDGNGFPSGGDFGNSFLRISTAGGGMAVADYFASSNTVQLSNGDEDLGSGGELLLPDVTDASAVVHHLMVGAGKEGTIYVVDRDSMGHFNASSNTVYQQLAVLHSVYATPAYFNGAVYYCDVQGTCKSFAVSNARLATTPGSQTATAFAYPGSAPVVSASGTANGILWVHENVNPAVLHAYDAGNLAHELYNSNQVTCGRDHFGPGNKFITPAVADGKVFVGTQNSVAVFGLL